MSEKNTENQQLKDTIVVLNETISDLNEQIKQQNGQIQQLMEMIYNANRHQFGKSSEKIDDNQTSLFEDENHPFDDPEKTEDKSEADNEICQSRKSAPLKRSHEEPRFDHEVSHVVTLAEKERLCPNCQKPMARIGKVLTKVEYELIPAHIDKHVYEVESYACRCRELIDGTTTVVTASAPKGPMQNKIGASLIARVICQKFETSTPFNRMVNDLKKIGLPTNRKQLASWVNKTCNTWLTPLYQLLQQKLITHSVLHADETPYKILNRSDGRSGDAESRIWVLTTDAYADHPITFFHSALTRKQEVAQQLFEGFHGILLTDGYSAYNNLPNVTKAACWAHVRRKFYDASLGGKYPSTGLKLIDRLFNLERKFKSLTTEDRQLARQQYSLPIVNQFWEWTSGEATMKGLLQKAINYAVKLKDALMAFLENGKIALSNNIAERAIRPITVGRKNSYFSTSEAGGTALAIGNSIIQTAKANGLDAEKYITKLLTDLPNLRDLNSPEVLEGYLPWNPQIQIDCKNQ